MSPWGKFFKIGATIEAKSPGQLSDRKVSIGYKWGDGILTFDNHRPGFAEEINTADLRSARCIPRPGAMTTT
jgi:hypothetical protein